MLGLRRVGLSPERLTKIVRKAVVDYYAESGGSLGGDRLEDAIAFVRERLLAGELAKYDPALAGGVSPETFTYRRARFRVTDWLRSKGEGLEFGDARSGAQGRVSLTSDGELEVAQGPSDSVDEAVERLAAGLSERSRWTLRHVASAAAEGMTIAEVVEGLMRDLADELRPQLPEELQEQLSGGEPSATAFASWFGVAA